jgi:hypothetical protein
MRRFQTSRDFGRRSLYADERSVYDCATFGEVASSAIGALLFRAVFAGILNDVVTNFIIAAIVMALAYGLRPSFSTAKVSLLPKQRHLWG